MYKDSTVFGLWHVSLFTDKADMYIEKCFPSTPISTETETREKAHLHTNENYVSIRILIRCKNANAD